MDKIPVIVHVLVLSQLSIPRADHEVGLRVPAAPNLAISLVTAIATHRAGPELLRKFSITGKVHHNRGCHVGFQLETKSGVSNVQ